MFINVWFVLLDRYLRCYLYLLYLPWHCTVAQQLVFGRDMLFNMKKEINWKLISENKRKQIACDNERENAGLIVHTYKVGDEVLRLKRGIKIKYSKNKSDPYKIIKVHSNGTVTMKQGVKPQCISIRNIEPYNIKKTI